MLNILFLLGATDVNNLTLELIPYDLFLPIRGPALNLLVNYKLISLISKVAKSISMSVNSVPTPTSPLILGVKVASFYL